VGNWKPHRRDTEKLDRPLDRVDESQRAVARRYEKGLIQAEIFDTDLDQLRAARGEHTNAPTKETIDGAV